MTNPVLTKPMTRRLLSEGSNKGKVGKEKVRDLGNSVWIGRMSDVLIARPNRTRKGNMYGCRNRFKMFGKEPVKPPKVGELVRVGESLYEITRFQWSYHHTFGVPSKYQQTPFGKPAHDYRGNRYWRCEARFIIEDNNV